MVPEERSECGGVVVLVVRFRVRVGVKTSQDKTRQVKTSQDRSRQGRG